MSDWVMVNGARIERSFLEANIAEVRSVGNWNEGRFSDASGHTHCIVWGVAIAKGDVGFESTHGWVCAYCYGTFVSR
jgi:hypothetical protein